MDLHKQAIEDQIIAKANISELIEQTKEIQRLLLEVAVTTTDKAKEKIHLLETLLEGYYPIQYYLLERDLEPLRDEQEMIDCLVYLICESDELGYDFIEVTNSNGEQALAFHKDVLDDWLDMPFSFHKDVLDDRLYMPF